MYKVWSVADIKIIINEISEKWNYPCNIKIEISKRAKKEWEPSSMRNAIIR